jgi:hypothetical protein
MFERAPCNTIAIDGWELLIFEMAWLVDYIGILHVSVAAIKASTNNCFSFLPW